MVEAESKAGTTGARRTSGRAYPRSLLAVALALCLAAGGCFSSAEEAPPEADSASLRQTTEGPVTGFTTREGAHAWKGIPFAKPPVGPLRWRAPRPPEKRAEVLEALGWGPSCVQFASPMAAGDDVREGDPTGSEDCLYLNIFAPRFAADSVPRGDARLPVLFWIHGGGNSIGDATLYDAAALAASQNVIVVSTHYRLGAFGWLSHPAFRGELEGGGEADALARDDASGNYGTLDLVQGLRWVRDNAASFGGDPKRVTVFGESAGGSNTFSMLLSPRAAGLFQRAIVQSGGARTTPLREAENFVDDAEPGDEYSSNEVLLKHLVRDGKAKDRGEAKAKLAAMDDAEIRGYLRGKSASEILTLYGGNGLGGMYFAPRLLEDGWVLPDVAALEAFRQGRYNQVPTILGTNRDENKLFMLFGSEYVTSVMQIPVWINDERLFLTNAEYSSNMWKVRGVDAPATEMRRRQGPSVFAYRFDWDDEPSFLWLDLGTYLGASHGLEIPFVFGRLSLGRATNLIFDPDLAESNEALSRAMMSYWSEFARTGKPGRGRDGKLPQWTSWSPDHDEGDKFLIFDSATGGGVRMSPGVLTREGLIAQVAGDARLQSTRERCEIYHGYVRWGRVMSDQEYAEVESGACQDFPLDAYPWKS